MPSAARPLIRPSSMASSTSDVTVRQNGISGWMMVSRSKASSFSTSANFGCRLVA